LSRPFDEARYRALLEGLEMAVIWKSAINEELRYEAEFYRQRYLHEDMALSHWPTQTIGEFAYVTDGPHGYHIVDELSPIVMLTAKNAKDWFSERDGADPIAGSVDIKNKRSSLEAGDIILSTRGTVGMCALVIEESLPANIDQDVARITWPDKQHLLPEFVVAYLNSTFGQDRITRYASGMVQQGLSLEKVREIPLPLLSPETQAAIAETVRAALRMRRQAVKNIHESEQTLLRALGLENWQPPEPLTYTRSSRDAFAAGRLDAEYFAPRVLELLHRLNTDHLTVGDMAPARHERFLPDQTGNFDYIEISDIRTNGTAISETIPHVEAPSRATWHVKAGDVITSMVRPIRRLSALIAPEQNGFVCSSGFVVLQPKAVPAEVLLTYLRLPPVCELMNLHTSASLYPAISETDLLALPIPHIDSEVQSLVVESVRAAQSSRRRAAQLLNAAQRAVEIVIETDEATALAFLNTIDERNSPSP